jgi:membrane protease YdiL (CAAX protease family)
VDWLLGIGLPIAGALFLVGVGKRTNSIVRYQLVTLGGAIVLSGLSLKFSPNDSIFKFGDLKAPANNFIGASYLAFTVIAFAVTSLVVYLQLARSKHLNKTPLIRFALISIPLSAMNSLTEELIFRATILQSATHLASPMIIAILSGLLFGIPHNFGNPGKLPGVVMATFLGVMAAQSIFDTGGLGWAWIMHFVQDLPIITILLSTGVKKL